MAACDVGTDPAQAQALEREKVALGHDAAELCAVEHDDVPDTVARHQQRSIPCAGTGRKRERRSRHDLLDRRA
jgi:hypothetical protein